MRRLRKFLDFDKEERWLNEMAGAGWLLVRRRLRYEFRRIDPGSAVVRVDFRDRGMSRADFDDYRTLFADAGWQHLDGSRRGGAQYFAASSTGSDADIFSDEESRAARYRRSLAWRGIATVPLLLVLVALLGGPSRHLSAPVDWYLTPGLWDMRSWEFIGHFLLETPFALMRGALPYIVLLAALLLLVELAAQYRLYRRMKSG